MITQITEVKSVIVQTDKDLYPTYRRHSKDNWERLLGESWEPYYSCEDMEEEYQDYINFLEWQTGQRFDHFR